MTLQQDVYRKYLQRKQRYQHIYSMLLYNTTWSHFRKEPPSKLEGWLKGLFISYYRYTISIYEVVTRLTVIILYVYVLTSKARILSSLGRLVLIQSGQRNFCSALGKGESTRSGDSSRSSFAAAIHEAGTMKLEKKINDRNQTFRYLPSYGGSGISAIVPNCTLLVTSLL